jgi:hypothetical protein
MSGAVPPLPNTPSWRAAQLKAQGQLYLLPLRIGGWVGPTAGLDAVAERKIYHHPLPGIESRSSSPNPSHYTD